MACGEAAINTNFRSANDFRPANNAPPPAPTERVVVNYSDWLNDGGSVSWNLDPGTYRLDLTANNDGATVELLGSNCPATQPMRELTINCEITRPGQLVVTNPSVWGMGKKVSVTVRVTQFLR